MPYFHAMQPDFISIEDYLYPLPPEKIARFPLAERDASKLLSYIKGKIGHHAFTELPDLLPENAALVFNRTRVIEARWLLRRSSGALIEVLVLYPAAPADTQSALQQQGQTIWHCMTGNKKKWKEGETLITGDGSLEVQLSWEDRDKDLVRFTWTPGELSFAEVLEHTGKIPIPPYLERESEALDTERYQTIYSKEKGSVAAPTAGLHFTEKVMEALKKKNIPVDYLTLHVGAGTFKPVKAANAIDHEMHPEEILVSRENLQFIQQQAGNIIPVGTTSLRSLESIYWLGVKLKSGNRGLSISQEDAWKSPADLPAATAIGEIMNYMEEKKQSSLRFFSSIYIYPGYDFRLCRGLITNFHQPGSTLLLLIAALVGDDWKRIYAEALEKNYRFLSYGDSSLLIP